MKKLLLLAALFSFSIARSQTSVYHPFPDSNAVWNFHTMQWWCGPSGAIDSYYSIYLDGDTSINNQDYHKLSIPYVHSVIVAGCNPYVFAGYAGSLREDTASRRVFYIPPGGTSEDLLYDFTWEVADTITGFLASWNTPNDTVSLIDSVLVGSDYRKRWHINPCYNITVIEGIGSTYGLIQPSIGCITDGPGFELTCFTQDGATLYPNTTMNCPLITGIDNVESVDNAMMLAPNPFHSTAKLEVSSDFDNAAVDILDMHGRLIRREGIISQRSATLHRNELAAGIYLVRLSNSKGQLAFKRFVVE